MEALEGISGLQYCYCGLGVCKVKIEHFIIFYVTENVVKSCTLLTCNEFIEKFLTLEGTVQFVFDGYWDNF